MPKINRRFAKGQTPPDNDYVDGDLNTPGLNELLDNSNETVDYLDFFVGSTITEPRINFSSDGTTIIVEIDKIDGGDITYRVTGETKILTTTPAVQLTLTPGTDSTPVTNYVYIDHSTETLVVNTTGFPNAPYTPIGEYFLRSALYHQTRGVLGTSHKNHVFTPGNNGHMEHLNASRRKQPCIFENGCLLTFTGSGTSTVNVALSSGQVSRLHLHDLSGLQSPAEFLINNDEVSTDIIETNLHNVTTFTDGSDNINKYCVYVFFMVFHEDTTVLFLLKPSAGYNIETEALTDPDSTAQFDIPAKYKGMSLYVSRVIARRTSTATEILQNNTDVRSNEPGTILDAFARLQNQIIGIGYKGVVTNAEMVALTGISAGAWVTNSDIDYQRFTYTGSFWVGDDDIVLSNATGAVPVIGKSVIIDTGSDFSAIYATATYDTGVIGVVADGDIDSIVIAINRRAQVLMEGGGSVSSGGWLFSIPGGLNISTTRRVGTFGLALESKSSTSDYLVWALIGTQTEAY